MTYDVAVAGLGGIGSAIVAHCAARGTSVVGFDRFARGHDLGSSTGKSRLIRKAYFEDPAYVPLLQRAYDLWRKLEHDTGADLLRLTGVLVAGAEESEIVHGVQHAARAYDLPIESLSKRQMRARYPTLRLLDGEIGVLECDGGVLAPERAIEAQLEVAGAAGAEMRFVTAMERWEASDNGVEVQLTDGSRIAARVLILALGPWVSDALRSVGIEIRVQRNVQVWFSPASDAYNANSFPGFLLDRPGLPAPLYGFPDFGDGVKAAFHGFGELVAPDAVDREIHESADLQPLARAMEEWMPGAAAAYREAKVCMYSLTADHDFVVDRHPTHRNVVVCGGFSGHGFKFAPVIGEIAADLALDGGTRHAIGFLSAGRFASGTGVSAD